MTPMWRVIFLLALLGLVLAACGTGVAAPTAPTPTARLTPQPAILTGLDTPGVLRPSACPFALPDDLVEGEDVECGYLPVYEHREAGSSGDGRLIRLAVAVFHPPGGATQPDPVIYLSGGPGASILKLIGTQVEVFSEPVFASGRSLIVFDQRGIGLSKPALDCPEFTALNHELLDRQQEGQSLGEQEVAALAVRSG